MPFSHLRSLELLKNIKTLRESKHLQGVLRYSATRYKPFVGDHHEGVISLENFPMVSPTLEMIRYGWDGSGADAFEMLKFYRQSHFSQNVNKRLQRHDQKDFPSTIIYHFFLLANR